MVLLNIQRGRSHGRAKSSLSKSKCFSAEPEYLSDTETCVVACRYTPQMTVSTIININGWHATLFIFVSSSRLTLTQIYVDRSIDPLIHWSIRPSIHHLSIYPSIHYLSICLSVHPSIRPSRVMGCVVVYPSIQWVTGGSTPSIGAPTHHSLTPRGNLAPNQPNVHVFPLWEEIEYTQNQVCSATSN